MCYRKKYVYIFEINYKNAMFKSVDSSVPTGYAAFEPSAASSVSYRHGSLLSFCVSAEIHFIWSH